MPERPEMPDERQTHVLRPFEGAAIGWSNELNSDVMREFTRSSRRSVRMVGCSRRNSRIARPRAYLASGDPEKGVLIAIIRSMRPSTSSATIIRLPMSPPLLCATMMTPVRSLWRRNCCASVADTSIARLLKPRVCTK